VCAPGYAKSVRHVAGKVKARVYRAYGVADHDGYIIDHSRGRQPHVPSATTTEFRQLSDIRSTYGRLDRRRAWRLKQRSEPLAAEI
jgi:hypothetical protein